MSDITWRDAYNDAEGLAEALDEVEQRLIKAGRYSDATDVHWAAHVLRELAEQEAELLAPTPAPEGQALREAFEAGWRKAVRTVAAAISDGMPVSVTRYADEYVAVLTPERPEEGDK